MGNFITLEGPLKVGRRGSSLGHPSKEDNKGSQKDKKWFGGPLYC